MYSMHSRDCGIRLSSFTVIRTLCKLVFSISCWSYNMPEPKRPCLHCSRVVVIHRGLSLHYAHRPSCFLAEKLSIRNSQTSQSNLPNWSNDVADTISSPDPPHLNATLPHLEKKSMTMRLILILIPTVMLLCPVVLAMLVQDPPCIGELGFWWGRCS